MLEVRGLDSFYGDSHILHGIDLVVPTGKRVALLGRNGAGKSTFLKSVMNAGPSVKGRLTWNGADLKTRSPHESARLGIAFVPEDRRILSMLTVLEKVLEQFPMLMPIKDRLGGFLSGGQQQLLALARAAVAMPKMLLLDEPTEGLAPIIVEQLARDVIRIC